jgi:hypothetical protein
MLHLVRRTCSCFSFPFVSYSSWIVNAANFIWTCAIPPPSPTEDDSNFIVISRALSYNTTFSWIKGLWISGRSLAINHSWCCWSRIWKVILPIKSLNLWSKYQMDSVYTCLISFSYVMYCDSEFGFLNSFNIYCLISANVLACPIGMVLCIFIYHNSARPLNVVSNW